jgi:hypothetical protein
VARRSCNQGLAGRSAIRDHYRIPDPGPARRTEAGATIAAALTGRIETQEFVTVEPEYKRNIKILDIPDSADPFEPSLTNLTWRLGRDQVEHRHETLSALDVALLARHKLLPDEFFVPLARVAGLHLRATCPVDGLATFDMMVALAGNPVLPPKAIELFLELAADPAIKHKSWLAECVPLLLKNPWLQRRHVDALRQLPIEDIDKQVVEATLGNHAIWPNWTDILEAFRPIFPRQEQARGGLLSFEDLARHYHDPWELIKLPGVRQSYTKWASAADDSIEHDILLGLLANPRFPALNYLPQHSDAWKRDPRVLVAWFLNPQSSPTFREQVEDHLFKLHQTIRDEEERFPRADHGDDIEVWRRIAIAVATKTSADLSPSIPRSHTLSRLWGGQFNHEFLNDLAAHPNMDMSILTGILRPRKGRWDDQSSLVRAILRNPALPGVWLDYVLHRRFSDGEAADYRAIVLHPNALIETREDIIYRLVDPTSFDLDVRSPEPRAKVKLLDDLARKASPVESDYLAGLMFSVREPRRPLLDPVAGALLSEAPLDDSAAIKLLFADWRFAKGIALLLRSKQAELAIQPLRDVIARTLGDAPEATETASPKKRRRPQ